MNFTMKFRDTTHIFTIKVSFVFCVILRYGIDDFACLLQKLLRERHGRMEDLKICFNHFTEANEVHNEMLMLKDCGCAGKIPDVLVGPTGVPSFDESTLPVVQVFYDFKPTDFSDPVLLFFK